MEAKITKEQVDDYFRLIYKYPIYIEMFRQYSHWNSSSEMITENTQIDRNYQIPKESIYQFLYKQYQTYVEAEEEIQAIERTKQYQYPVFCFDLSKIMKYTEDELMSTSEKIIYYNYLLKEYPQHISTRMNVLSEKLNDLYLDGENIEKIILLFTEIDKTKESPYSNLQFPIPPQTFEEQIIKELRYLNVQLNIELLESKYKSEGYDKTSKFKDEIKRLKRVVEQKDEADTLFTLPEAMNYLKISRTTLYRMVKNGILHYQLIGRKKYISKQEIMQKINVINGRRGE